MNHGIRYGEKGDGAITCRFCGSVTLYLTDDAPGYCKRVRQCYTCGRIQDDEQEIEFEMCSQDWILSVVQEIDLVHERVCKMATDDIPPEFLETLVKVGDNLTNAVLKLHLYSLEERFAIHIERKIL